MTCYSCGQSKVDSFFVQTEDGNKMVCYNCMKSTYHQKAIEEVDG